jgi:hypothetical protein
MFEGGGVQVISPLLLNKPIHGKYLKPSLKIVGESLEQPLDWNTY